VAAPGRPRASPATASRGRRWSSRRRSPAPPRRGRAPPRGPPPARPAASGLAVSRSSGPRKLPTLLTSALAAGIGRAAGIGGVGPDGQRRCQAGQPAGIGEGAHGVVVGVRDHQRAQVGADRETGRVVTCGHQDRRAGDQAPAGRGGRQYVERPGPLLGDELAHAVWCARNGLGADDPGAGSWNSGRGRLERVEPLQVGDPDRGRRHDVAGADREVRGGVVATTGGLEVPAVR